jgi:DNA helicase-2/ATP-dependent DNA helicase PcrA
MFIPRPKQQEILAYQGGKMGVAAVPGSGKTQILSVLAAQIISSGALADEQEVLVVTLVNSAVDNFASRVGNLVEERGLLSNLGYRVRTLHGLAHDIVRERPDLVGLSEDFQIIDERAAAQIREDASLAWIRSHPYALDDLLSTELDEGKQDWVRRDRLPDKVSDVALAFIRSAKDGQVTPEQLHAKLEALSVPMPLADMGCDIYQAYQRALLYRGAVDFDDLIRLALQAIKTDEDYLKRLGDRWPYILEDEAQDSSELQEQILAKLSALSGNWVRVGDPNQAIFETFTTASPKHLRDFLRQPEVINRDMPNSGRSTASIIELANYLIRWTQGDHPREEVRSALSPPEIEMTPDGDPQPNPQDDPWAIHIIDHQLAPQEEIQYVVNSIAEWLPSHADDTVAVLVPRNQRGFELVDELRRQGLEFSDNLLRSTTATRSSAGVLGNLLNYLADPGSAKKLATVHKVWRREDWEDEQHKPRLERINKLIRGCRKVEEYLWPRAGRDWLAAQQLGEGEGWIADQLKEFRDAVHRWQGATMLPIDQLIISLAQDIFHEPADLAIAHKLSLLLSQSMDVHPEWRLEEFTEELAVIARNERRFLGFSEDDLGFDPQKYKGQVVVATMHKSKGLEWDRVYLMSVNNYDFPSGQPYDRYIAEPWFLRSHLNLEAEALQQLELVLNQDEYSWYQEGQASTQARLEYVSERLRLFYVAITRAKQELIITWNTGRKGDQLPAQSLQALRAYWGNRLSKLGGKPG